MCGSAAGVLGVYFRQKLNIVKDTFFSHMVEDGGSSYRVTLEAPCSVGGDHIAGLAKQL